MLGTGRKPYLVGIAAVVAAAMLGACSSDSGSGDSGSGGSGVKVGLLLPENATARYEQFDRPTFKAALASDCPKCTFLYANAQGDASKQQTQAESMLAQGAKVLVLFPVDGTASATIVTAAHAKGAKVIGDGRTPGGPVDYTVSYQDAQLGEGNGGALKTSLDAAGRTNGKLVWLNGDQTTPNTPGIRAAARTALSGYTVGKEFFVKNWDPANAQKSMDQAITELGKDNIIGVFSMNDGMATGAVAAMKSAGMKPVPVSGMDADVAAVQRILVGEQTSSLYSSPIDLEKAAAKVAADVAAGKTPETDTTIKNATGQKIKSKTPPTPQVVTIKTIKTILIDPGVYKASQICTGQFAAACTKAGIQ